MVNKWQMFFLIVLTLPIMGHVVLLPLAINLAGRDVWISAIIAIPIGFLFSFILYRLRLIYPDEPICKAQKSLFGNFASNGIAILFFLYFTFLASLSIAALIDMVNASFLIATPSWILVAVFLLLSMYGAAKGAKGIALTAGILFFIVMLTGHSITFTNFRERDIYELMPLLEHGWKPVLLGALLFSTVWIELLFLLTIPLEHPCKKYTFTLWLVSVIANVFMMLSTSTGAIMTFGLEQTDNFVYPALEIVRVVTLKFIDRLDVYALILMTFGSFIRGSLFLLIAYEQLTVLKKPNKKGKNVVVFTVISILIGIFAYIMVDTRRHLEFFLTLYAYTIVLFPLPFLLLFLAKYRKRKGYY